MTAGKKELPVRAFKSARAWAAWLASNHARSPGVWLRFFKKGSGVASVDHAEALDEALRYGWIDGQARPRDEKSWLQRFTRRRSRSAWSRRNAERVERLTRAGAMKAAGLAEAAAAKADGRWAAAYDSPRNAVVPDDFLKALRRSKKALAFFDSLNKANRYSIAYRLQTARKPETRERRLKAILRMMAKGETFH